MVIQSRSTDDRGAGEREGEDTLYPADYHHVLHAFPLVAVTVMDEETTVQFGQPSNGAGKKLRAAAVTGCSANFLSFIPPRGSHL